MYAPYVCPACGGYGDVRDGEVNPVAVLSTIVIPEDGVYQVETISIDSGLSALEAHCQEGPILHFIGHPATQQIVEDCGAVYAGQGALFSGLKVGQWALCFPIHQGRSDRSQGGSAVNQEVRRGDLSCRRISRLS